MAPLFLEVNKSTSQQVNKSTSQQVNESTSEFFEILVTPTKGVSSVSGVSSVPQREKVFVLVFVFVHRGVSGVSLKEGTLTKPEGRLTKRACERLTKCAARLTEQSA